VVTPTILTVAMSNVLAKYRRATYRLSDCFAKPAYCCGLRVFCISPDNSLDSPKSSEGLLFCGDHRPFLRRYWIGGGDGTIAPGEFLKSLDYPKLNLIAWQPLDHFAAWPT